MSTLREVITEKTLRSLAGGRSYSRGEEYFESGLVGPLSEKNEVISAKVHGSHTYDSRLKIEAEGKGRFRLGHVCTCPVGRDGDFCKHAVALGLAWIDKNEAVGEKPSSTSAVSSNEMGTELFSEQKRDFQPRPSTVTGQKNRPAGQGRPR